MDHQGKVVVAMSGGVDSSLAAALVKEQGYCAVGVTLKLLARADTGFGCCGSPADVDDARRVCETLGIPHYLLNLSELFEDKVIKPFIASYLEARTPNPCVECNRSLKFGYLLALADAWGAGAVATGHYARAAGGRLLRASDAAKDQSYFLYSLTARELGKVMFPVGELTKTQVREKARGLGLKTADKPESQEICFVPAKDYRGFITSQLEAPELEPALSGGPIKDLSGREVGRHSGVAGYTVGQAKGLGLGGGEKRFVVRLEAETNTVVVGNDKDIFCRSFTAERVTWSGARPAASLRAATRVRHRHEPAACLLTPRGDGRVDVTFDEPQRAVTPGQAAVFYAGDEVLGGGSITRRMQS